MDTTEAFHILGLQSTAREQDIRQAYRGLVKQHHPDLFPDKKRKAQQQAILTRLNQAYSCCLASLPVASDGNSRPASPDHLYREAVALYNRHVGSISLGFRDYLQDKAQLLARIKDVERAIHCLRHLLLCHPYSIWVPDARERLELLETHRPNLDTNLAFIDSHTLHWNTRGTPVWVPRRGG